MKRILAAIACLLFVSVLLSGTGPAAHAAPDALVHIRAATSTSRQVYIQASDSLSYKTRAIQGAALAGAQAKQELAYYSALNGAAKALAAYQIEQAQQEAAADAAAAAAQAQAQAPQPSTSPAPSNPSPPPSPPPPSSPPPSSSVGASALNWALQYNGGSYCWGGNGPCFDCSGLVVAAFAQFGISLPRTTYDMPSSPHLVPVSESEARYGDLVMWPGHGHVEFWGANGQTFGALNPSAGIGWHQIWQQPSDFYRVV
jgi:cell wall-associated NlpC family hydrolase